MNLGLITSDPLSGQVEHPFLSLEILSSLRFFDTLQYPVKLLDLLNAGTCLPSEYREQNMKL